MPPDTCPGLTETGDTGAAQSSPHKLKEASLKSLVTKAQETIDNANGRVGVPILMYIFGVPGFVCVLAWLFFFRGH